jgi:hypothetical protein
MAGLTRYTRQALLDHLMGVAVFTPPTDFYIGLFTAAPTPIDAGTEVAGINYQRILHNDWHAATAGEPSISTNVGNIVFPESGGSWGTIVAAGIFTAVEGGALIAYGLCNQECPINTVIRFLDSQLAVTINETV